MKICFIYLFYLLSVYKQCFHCVSIKMEEVYQSCGAKLFYLSEIASEHPVTEQVFLELDQTLFRDGITLVKIGYLLSFARHIILKSPEKKEFVHEQVYKSLRKYFSL